MRFRPALLFAATATGVFILWFYALRSRSIHPNSVTEKASISELDAKTKAIGLLMNRKNQKLSKLTKGSEYFGNNALVRNFRAGPSVKKEKGSSQLKISRDSDSPFLSGPKRNIENVKVRTSTSKPGLHFLASNGQKMIKALDSFQNSVLNNIKKMSRNSTLSGKKNETTSLPIGLNRFIETKTNTTDGIRKANLTNIVANTNRSINLTTSANKPSKSDSVMAEFHKSQIHDSLETGQSNFEKYIKNVKTSWNTGNGPAPAHSDDLVGGGKLEVTVPVHIDTRKRLRLVSGRFLSIGIDSNLIRSGWKGFDFSSLRLRNLARALSPAYVRVMGADGDRMIFNPDCQKTRPRNTETVHTIKKGFIFPTTNFYMYCRDWDRINRFAMNVGWRVLFGFNAQLRKGHDWDSTNADQLLSYTITKSYAQNLDFELGNQPEAYQSKYLFRNYVGPVQLAKDYRVLRTLLRSPKYRTHFRYSMIGGPATGKFATSYLQRFLGNGSTAVDVITWHQYYGSEDIGNVESAVNADVLDRFTVDLQNVMKIIRRTSHRRRRVWLGETGSVAVPPGNNVYESYAMTYMLLDKLGLSAVHGIDVVIKQTFYGLWSALVDSSLQPTPGFWVAALHKKLVGRSVLRVNVSDDHSKHVRVYSHCTNSRVPYNKAGELTIFALNLYDAKVEIKLDEDYAQQQVHQYLLTPYSDHFGITSKFMALNGKLLAMTDTSDLPNLKPVILKPGGLLHLPAKSLAFYVLPDAKAAACMYNK